MNVLILAAGYATRLYPLTLKRAKPLLAVGGKPIIEWLVDNLVGIPDLETIHVVTNDKFAADFQAWSQQYQKRHPELKFKIVNDGSRSDDDKLGAIGDIDFVLTQENLSGSSFLIAAGDNLFTDSLADFVAYAKGSEATVAVHDVGDAEAVPVDLDRDLVDRAHDWEADIIRTFRDEPSRQELVTERDTPTGPLLHLARPITIRSEACLTCHSTPYDAPQALTRTYGTVNGYGWKLNETIGAQILSVPMALPLKVAHDSYVTSLIILVLVFAVVFVVLNMLLHYLVIAPVKRVSAAAEAVSLGDENVESYVKAGKDEISTLSVAFNRMRESLKHAMDMLK